MEAYQVEYRIVILIIVGGKMMKFGYLEELSKKYLTMRKEDFRELDLVTIGMLESNDMKDVLPFYSLQVNDFIEFRYDITGYINVRNRFLGKIINRNNILHFLNAIVDMCSMCNNYMIDVSQVVLDPEYIYIEEHGKQIKFILLPVMHNDIDFNNALKSMLLKLKFDDSVIELELFRYFNQNKEFSLMAFSNMVKAIECSNPQESAPGRNRESESVNKVVENKEIDTSNKKEDKKEEVEAQGESKKNKKRLSLFGKNKKKPNKETKNVNNIFGRIAIPGIEDGGYSKNNVDIPNKEQDINSRKVLFEKYDVEEENFGETVIHQSDEENWKDNKTSYPYRIVRFSTGESYEITKFETKLGRTNSIVDICILGNPHVGRLHAILYKKEDELFIQDNGSINGTYVNALHNRIDEKVSLYPGDVFYLGDEKFIVE